MSGKVRGWIRVSGRKQDEENQRHEILEYVSAHQMFIAEGDWFSYTVSTRKAKLQALLGDMLATMQAGDTLIVSELSRLGRNMRDIHNLIHALRERTATVICIKESLILSQEETVQGIAMLGSFAMLAEMERALNTQRTIEALAARVAQGVKLGRKPNKQGKTKLDDYAKEIKEFFEKGASVTSIARIIGAKVSTVNYYVRSRGLARALQ